MLNYFGCLFQGMGNQLSGTNQFHNSFFYFSHMKCLSYLVSDALKRMLLLFLYIFVALKHIHCYRILYLFISVTIVIERVWIF